MRSVGSTKYGASLSWMCRSPSRYSGNTSTTAQSSTPPGGWSRQATFLGAALVLASQESELAERDAAIEEEQAARERVDHARARVVGLEPHGALVGQRRSDRPEREPDRTSRAFTLGPTFMVAHDSLAETGLVRGLSLVIPESRLLGAFREVAPAPTPTPRPTRTPRPMPATPTPRAASR